jgi:hypothetical protein
MLLTFVLILIDERVRQPAASTTWTVLNNCEGVERVRTGSTLLLVVAGVVGWLLVSACGLLGVIGVPRGLLDPSCLRSREALAPGVSSF